MNQIELKKFKQEQERLIALIEPELSKIRELVVKMTPPYDNERFVMELLRVGVFQGYIQGAMAGLLSYGDIGKKKLTQEETYRAGLRQLLRPLIERMQKAESESQEKDSPTEDSSS
tara:strand:- start:26107 stop:26454 length:348 start_codon:yes stop_codon:yes gene_type:complete